MIAITIIVAVIASVQSVSGIPNLERYLFEIKKITPISTDIIAVNRFEYCRHFLFCTVMPEAISIDAAGIAAPAGLEASLETQELLSNEGIDVSRHKARLLTDDMVLRADLILVMEKRHELNILERVPSARNRLYLLKEFANMIDIRRVDLRENILQATYYVDFDSNETLINAMEKLNKTIPNVSLTFIDQDREARG